MLEPLDASILSEIPDPLIRIVDPELEFNLSLSAVTVRSILEPEPDSQLRLEACRAMVTDDPELASRSKLSSAFQVPATLRLLQP